MENFVLPEEYTIECRAEKTRYGFRHLAFLRKNFIIVEKAKACYYNRTWERYDFQTVIHEVINKHFSEKVAEAYKQIADKQAIEGIEKTFRCIGQMAKLGDVFGESKAESNKFKKRMLQAGMPGVEFPDDFEDLPEEEKEKRLNKVINFTLEPSH